MTPPLDLVECANCDCWFTAAATDELFHHATARCRREAARRAAQETSEASEKRA